MRVNNYQGTVADRPVDTVVVEPATIGTPQLPANRPSFMDNIVSRLNGQNNVIPAGNLPVYDKG